MNIFFRHSATAHLRDYGGGGLVTKSCPTLATPWERGGGIKWE